MDTDATAAQRMAEFARSVAVLRERPRHVQHADFASPVRLWAEAVDAAASLMEPHWDRFWSKPTDDDALTALAIIIYAVGGGEPDGDAARDLLAGCDIHGPGRRRAEARLTDAVSTALIVAGHDLTDAHDPVVAAWNHLTKERGQEGQAAPEFLHQTSFPEIFGHPGRESLLFRAMPTISRATVSA